MALSIQLPIQAIHYVPTVNIFQGTFNTPAAGKYSFNITANQNTVIMPLEINSMYLIERMFISGNIPAEDYLSSMDFDFGTEQIPSIRIKTKLNAVQSHTVKIPIVQFTENREAPILVHTDKKDDQLLMSMSGQLKQIDNTVGIDPVIICIGLSIYQFNEKSMNEGLRTAMSAQFGLGKKSSS